VRRLGGKAALLLGLLPVVVATAIAGTITNPSRVRPCASEYSTGASGGLHIVLGPDRMLYMTASTADRILRFDPDTHRTTSLPLPKGTVPHDIIRGPDGKLWFDGLSGRIGNVDPANGKATIVAQLPPGREPHDLAFSGGKLYIAEPKPGRLARFDPGTGAVTEFAAGLPPRNEIHSMRAVDGFLWTSLSNANALARFNPKEQRFDKLVHMPVRDSGPRDLVYVPSRHSIYFTLFAANRIGRYDVATGRLTLYRTPVKPISLSDAESPKQGFEKLTFITKSADQSSIWATTFYGEVVRLNLDTRKVTTVHCGITFPAATAGLATDAKGRLWVNEAFPARIAEIRP
jgi:sugar lactone lactonase YvrE